MPTFYLVDRKFCFSLYTFLKAKYNSQQSALQKYVIGSHGISLVYKGKKICLQSSFKHFSHPEDSNILMTISVK